MESSPPLASHWPSGLTATPHDRVPQRPRVLHFCLVAPYEVFRARLQQRGGAGEWEERRARECCDVHGDARFAMRIDAEREPSAIVQELLTRLRQE